MPESYDNPIEHHDIKSKGNPFEFAGGRSGFLSGLQGEKYKAIETEDSYIFFVPEDGKIHHVKKSDYLKAGGAALNFGRTLGYDELYGWTDLNKEELDWLRGEEKAGKE